ncbi:MAG: hypothetical protein ACR2NZ_02740 [Rubripirellula sp.]
METQRFPSQNGLRQAERCLRLAAAMTLIFMLTTGQPLQALETRGVTVADATAIFNASRFDAPGRSSAQAYSTPLMGSYLLNETVENSLGEVRQAFKTQGWKELHLEDSDPRAAMLQVTKDGLLVNASLSPRGEDSCQLYLGVLGNVDVRTLPKPTIESTTHERLDFLMYVSPLSPEQVTDFYRTELAKVGWQPYGNFPSDANQNESRKLVRLRNHGVSINVVASPSGSQSQVMVTVGMLEQDVPTPAIVSDLRLDASLFRQSFRSTQSASQLLAFFVVELKELGWIIHVGKRFGDQKVALFLTNPRQEPRFLEIVSSPEGVQRVYLGTPTRQVKRAVKSPPEFELEYAKGLPMDQTSMHELPYMDLPFLQPEPDGSGRTVAESVFFNTRVAMEDAFEFYRKFLTEKGWQAGQRKNEMIGDKLFQATMTFKKSDAKIELVIRPWTDDTQRVTLQGSGIQWPGDGFCQMMAREESTPVE